MKDAILHAHERIRPHIRRTECVHSQSLSDASGAEVFLKLENRQLTGSFKLRGVANKLLSLTEEERGRQLVAASTGNHGAAFAHAVSEFGLDGVVKIGFIKNSVDRAHSVVIDNDGNIIVAGETKNDYTTFGLVRLIGK